MYYHYQFRTYFNVDCNFSLSYLFRNIFLKFKYMGLSQLSLLLISSISAFDLENTLHMISIFWNKLKFALWPRIWSFLMCMVVLYVSRELEKHYSLQQLGAVFYICSSVNWVRDIPPQSDFCGFFGLNNKHLLSHTCEGQKPKNKERQGCPLLGLWINVFSLQSHKFLSAYSVYY